MSFLNERPLLTEEEQQRLIDKNYNEKIKANVELTHPLLTNNYTRVLHEPNPKFGAPHHFQVIGVEGKNKSMCVKVNFQEGPIKENGVNGIANEDAIVMVLTRLNGFQQTPYACEENAAAIKNLEVALEVLRSRTDKRLARNVEGTHII